MRLRFSHALLGSALGLSSLVASAATPVDVELQLLVDSSASIDAAEFALQAQGYADAFRSAAVQGAITDTNGGRIGSIAVQLIYWSGASQQQVAVDWWLIDSAAAANAFADSILAASRPFDSSTAPGSALAFGDDLFFSNNFDGNRLVVDVSGDGTENTGIDTAGARDAALGLGIDQINGLVVSADLNVLTFYQDEIIGGDGAFVMAVDGFDDFGIAVQQKLMREIAPVPLPASAWMLLSALGGLAAVRRRARAAS